MPKKEEKHPKQGTYFQGVGRRKTAIARVRVFRGKGSTIVNSKQPLDYFHSIRFTESALAPLSRLKLDDKFEAHVLVKGGGLRAQADAVRHGLARALVSADDSLKPQLRQLGFLTRDPRMVERKKYGLKKARRAPQWQKR